MTLWRRFHDAVADCLEGESIRFLNYGLKEADDRIPPYGELAARYHVNLVRRVLGGVDLLGRRVLEVGSGRGGNCAYLSRHTAAGEIYGIDTCAGYLRDCRRTPSLARVTLLRADAQALPFRDHAFGVVMNVESAHCYVRFDRFVAEVARVLEPGGTFCFADLWTLRVLGVDWTERRRVLDTCGLIPIAEEDISREVFDALNAPDGLLSELTRMASDAVVEHLQRTTELVRVSLAVGECRYKLWRMQKP